MKHLVGLVCIVSTLSCTHPGDSNTVTTGVDSSAGRSVADSTGASNGPNGINGDTTMSRQGISAGVSDSDHSKQLDITNIHTVDTATGTRQNSSQKRSEKDTLTGKRPN